MDWGSCRIFLNDWCWGAAEGRVRVDKSLLLFRGMSCILARRNLIALLSNTQHSVDKLESLLKVLGYKVRYEKGNFKTAACVLEHSKVVVVNRFSNIETKISSLMGILRDMPAADGELDEKQRQFLQRIKQTRLTI